MQWRGPKFYGTRLAVLACIRVAFQSVLMHVCYVITYMGLVWSVIFFLFFRLRWVNAEAFTLWAHKIIQFITLENPKHNSSTLPRAVYAIYYLEVSFE
jgi:hypothetical protein